MESNINTSNNLYGQIAELIQSARKQVVTQVNTTLLVTYWNVGRLIVEANKKVNIGRNMESKS